MSGCGLSVHVVVVLFLLRGWREPGAFRAANLPLHVLRGSFPFRLDDLQFPGAETLQLAETMSIFFFAPMVITALAGPLLGEWAGWRRWLAVLAGFAGVLVITRPGFGVFAVGHVYALCATLSYCFYVIMTRQDGGDRNAGEPDPLFGSRASRPDAAGAAVLASRCRRIPCIG